MSLFCPIRTCPEVVWLPAITKVVQPPSGTWPISPRTWTAGRPGTGRPPLPRAPGFLPPGAGHAVRTEARSEGHDLEVVPAIASAHGPGTPGTPAPGRGPA